MYSKPLTYVSRLGHEEENAGYNRRLDDLEEVKSISLSLSSASQSQNEEKGDRVDGGKLVG